MRLEQASAVRRRWSVRLRTHIKRASTGLVWRRVPSLVSSSRPCSNRERAVAVVVVTTAVVVAGLRSVRCVYRCAGIYAHIDVQRLPTRRGVAARHAAMFRAGTDVCAGRVPMGE